MRQIILDTETTGLEPAQGHRVIEIGCLELINRMMTGKVLHFYLNPDRDSDPAALAVHGLTSEFLADKPRFKDIVEDLVDFLRGAEIIIHNAVFDTKFLNAELARLNRPGMQTFCGSVTDSLLHARELHPGKRNSLDALCERYSISNAHRTQHGALLDAELLAEVWLAMTRGQDTLFGDMQETVARRTGEEFSDTHFDAASLGVLKASAEEIREHDAYLQTLEHIASVRHQWGD